MKAILFALIAVAAVSILGSASAYTPFDVSGSGVIVESYELDLEVNSIILKTQVSDSVGNLELTFDREFFDSTYLGNDDKFFVIVDGDKLSYTETRTTSKSRTIEMNLAPGTNEVELFGSHLLGKTIDDYTAISKINEKEFLAKQIDDLSAELDQVRAENILLDTKNEELGKKIFTPANLISETEVQASNLISETEVQASNLISETEVQASNLISETEVQASNLISETEVQATALMSETEVQATALMSETEVQATNLVSIISEQINAITLWFKSFF